MGYSPQSTNFFQESEISARKGNRAGDGREMGVKKPV